MNERGREDVALLLTSFLLHQPASACGGTGSSAPPQKRESTFNNHCAKMGVLTLLTRPMLRAIVTIALLGTVAMDACAQDGLATILQGLEKYKNRLDRSIDHRRLSRSCPTVGLWALHIPTVSLDEPQYQQDFISGAFTKHLIPNERPSRWGRRGRIGMESYLFDSQDKYVGSVSMGYTFTSCDLNPLLKVTNQELARVSRDSIPDYILGLHWGSLNGFLYRTASGWYLVSDVQEGFRNEPFERPLQRSWIDLQQIGYRGYSIGPWSSE